HDLNRLTVEQGGLVAPLANRFPGRLDQKRRSAYVLQISDAAVRSDNRQEHYCALRMGLFGNGRILRYHLIYEIGGLHVAAAPNGLLRLLLFRRLLLLLLGRRRKSRRVKG